jgi:hypothetical protein
MSKTAFNFQVKPVSKYKVRKKFAPKVQVLRDKSKYQRNTKYKFWLEELE